MNAIATQEDGPRPMLQLVVKWIHLIQCLFATAVVVLPLALLLLVIVVILGPVPLASFIVSHEILGPRFHDAALSHVAQQCLPASSFLPLMVVCSTCSLQVQSCGNGFYP